MSNVALSLALPLVAIAIGEALDLDSPHTASLEADFATLVATGKSGADTTAAIEDAAATLAAAAASHSGNPTIVNAAKVLGDFPAARASAKAGQAVVIATPTIDGDRYLLSLEKEGGPAAETLGL